MIKLVSDLALARSGVDRSVALGEAIPRLARLKRMVVAALVVAVFLLTLGYAHLDAEIDRIHASQNRNTAAKQKILDNQEEMLARLGKNGASPQR